jgi:hypothetical protein
LALADEGCDAAWKRASELRHEPRRTAVGHSASPLKTASCSVALSLSKYLWQPRDVHGDPPRFVHDDPEADVR